MSSIILSPGFREISFHEQPGLSENSLCDLLIFCEKTSEWVFYSGLIDMVAIFGSIYVYYVGLIPNE